MTLKYTKTAPDTIRTMFDTIASGYDRTNFYMSFGMHHSWNRALVKEVGRSHHSDSLLDLCCGTGEIARHYANASRSRKSLYLLDFSEQMLASAKEKLGTTRYSHHKMQFLQADAQEIPLPDASVDTVTIAYGIRNVQDIARCAREVLRVLKPGGRFAILELTRPTNSFMRWGHHLYLRFLLPTVGRLFAANKDAYSYLASSIEAFPSPIALENTLRNEGFAHTHQKQLMGGTATIIVCTKQGQAR